MTGKKTVPSHEAPAADRQGKEEKLLIDRAGVLSETELAVLTASYADFSQTL